MYTLYPMDFEEFLLAMNEKLLIKLIKDCYKNNGRISEPVHEKALLLYRIHLITGGMPESVQNMLDINCDYVKYNKNILPDIVVSYFNDMNKYVISDSETLKINRTYKSLPSQLSNQSNKFQFSKIEKNARAREYEMALEWLKASNMINVSSMVKTPEIPLEGFVDNDTFKIYLSDVGILNSMLKLSIEDILTDNVSLYKGIIAENYVANQLLSGGHSLYYWQNNNKAEVDFYYIIKME